VRLLRAEVRKLNRPLFWGVAIASAMFCVLLSLGGASNAQQEARATPDRLQSCVEMRLPEGPACVRAQAVQRVSAAHFRNDRTSGAARVAAQLNPVAAGAEAAGLMASLPGALMLALLAGGHVGGEWSGRTLKNLLTQHGRRREVLGTKFLSLWFAGVGLTAVCWAALAIAGPIITRADHLPNSHESFVEAAKWAGSQTGRAVLVLAVFAAVAMLAAALTRNTIGTMASTAGAFVAMLVLAGFPQFGQWTPATWVQGWMGFSAGQGSITSLPNNFWSRFVTAGGSIPSHTVGLTGLVAVLVACAVLTWRAFEHADISG
jgi:ABC-type transport system involved in multi-copper enzyme maturation permease subunit